MADLSLAERVQDLPQELFDHILSYVVHVPIPEPQSDGFRYRRISSGHKYPAASRLNKFYRAQFACQFYDNTVLVFSSFRIFHKYAMTLAPEYFTLIAAMHVVFSTMATKLKSDQNCEVLKRAQSIGVELTAIMAAVQRWAKLGEFTGYVGRDEVLLAVKDSEQEWVGSWPEVS